MHIPYQTYPGFGLGFLSASAQKELSHCEYCSVPEICVAQLSKTGSPLPYMFEHHFAV